MTIKTRGRGEAPGQRGTTTGGAESEKRGKGGREEETEGGGETTEGGSRETDEGRGGMEEAKRGRQCLPPGSESTGSGRIGMEEELVKTDESGTSAVSSIWGGDEFDRSTPLDKKTTGLVSFQGDSGAMLGVQRNGERVRNRANGYR